MAKKQSKVNDKAEPQTPEEQRDAFIKAAQTPPRFTIVSDKELGKAEGHRDTFSLEYRLGPIFDIMRHKGTKTPMAVAIYGRWGVGKTSAMRWLQNRLDLWGKVKKNKRNKHSGIRTVWFDPWKYHDPDDVRRGIIAQVILATLQREDNAHLLAGAARKFGALGHGFLESLRAVKVRGKASGKGKGSVGIVGVEAGAGGEVEIDIDQVISAIEAAKAHMHPESIYLNQFEEALRGWTKDLLVDTDERLVIFIDDLDRCMPDVALRVLEAIKLYLNIPNLVFVVGVDHVVINQLVIKYYDKHGVKKEDSKDYLAKMFQVEVTLGPSDKEIGHYFEAILKQLSEELKVEDWNTLGKTEQGCLREAMRRLAADNPREVKRVVNSALIAGAGATMVDHEITFAQGMQVFLIDRMLRESLDFHNIQHTQEGREFLKLWSEAVIETGQPTIGVGDDVVKEAMTIGKGRGSAAPQHPDPLAREIAPQYLLIVQEQRFDAFVSLLNDPELDELLGELLRIPYNPLAASLVPAEAESVGETLEDAGSQIPAPPPPTIPRSADSARLREDRKILQRAVAASLGKPAEEVTPSDYGGVTELLIPSGAFASTELLLLCIKLRELDLADTAVTDLGPLEELTGLEKLRFDGTLVSDLNPLRALTELKVLWLNDTQVADLKPLKTLDELQELWLDNTQVADLEPLKTLNKLHYLSLNNTQVANFEPLKTLNKLQWLWLDNTQVADLEPLKALNELQILSLSHTKVADLKPLKTLNKLQKLRLDSTQVADIEPLKTLNELQMLRLDSTQVADIEPLKTLNELQMLSLNNTQVVDIEPLTTLNKLQTLSLNNTQVADIEPLTTLNKLQVLWLNDTQVADIKPLKTLNKLQRLSLDATQVADIEPLKTLNKLQVLSLSNTKVTDLEPLNTLNELRHLWFNNTRVTKESIRALQAALPECKIFH